MTTHVDDVGRRAAELRREFDQAFAAPRVAIDADTVDLLAVRIAGTGFAIRLLELSSLLSGRKVVPVPSHRKALVGLAGIRGAVAPVYSLAQALGYDGTSAARWLGICGSSDPIALALDDVDGFLRVRRSDVHRAAGTRSHVREVVQRDAHALQVVDTRSIVAELTSTMGQAAEQGSVQ
jgi:chemotaxis signal transduction protein